MTLIFQAELLLCTPPLKSNLFIANICSKVSPYIWNIFRFRYANKQGVYLEQKMQFLQTWKKKLNAAFFTPDHKSSFIR